MVLQDLRCETGAWALERRVLRGYGVVVLSGTRVLMCQRLVGTESDDHFPGGIQRVQTCSFTS